jgi:peptide/nickel transport system substrate-binding protein
VHKSAKLTLITALGVSAAMVIAACGSGRTDNTNTSSQPAGGSSSQESSAPAQSGESTETSSETGAPASGASIAVGTTDKVVSLDPAGSYDNGSLMLELQIYQFLMNIPAGQSTPTPDAAESCDFTDNGATYTCKMKQGLTFSNGDPLTAKDVAFSFKRVVDINDPNGPASLLGNMKSVDAPDDSTVVFTLNNANDQTWPFILGTSAGPIVDSKVYPADKLLPDEQAVGSGPYKVDSYSKNELVSLVPNTSYNGNGGAVKNAGVTLQYFTDASNLKLAVQQGDVDVAWRTLDPQSITDLRSNDKVKVLEGPGGEDRYIVFNLKTMPGDTDAQKLAIRRAIAYSIDRQQIATKVFQDQYQPAYSMVPDGFPGHVDAFKDEFGASPDKTAAAKELSDAGVKTPVTLPIEYNPDHYGSASDLQFNEIKAQLEATGLFKVNLQSAEWTTYSKERTQDAYPIYQLGWYPDFPDADNYLSPFLAPNNFVQAHYCDTDAPEGSRPCDTDGVLPLLTTEQTQSGDARTKAIEQIQKISATGVMPTLPLLQGKQIAVTGTDVTGVQDTLDATFLFRFWMIGKNS